MEECSRIRQRGLIDSMIFQGWKIGGLDRWDRWDGWDGCDGCDGGG